MTLDNTSLFELMAASRGASPAGMAVASAFADWIAWALPLAAAIGWINGDRRLRIDLLRFLTSLALGYALLAAVNAGRCDDVLTQCWDQPGSPNAQMVAWWAAALSLMWVNRFAWISFPLLTLNVAVGWSLVYLGQASPFDVLLALPIAAAATLATWALRRLLQPVFRRLAGRADSVRVRRGA
jgi:membrane-associated phospholipid phosphatase